MDALEIRRLSASWESALAEFFAALRGAGDERFFHPHPLTPEEAQRRARYKGKDLYYIMTIGTHVLGYGMLRGWDEGFEVPSLGIAIQSEYRGRGLGKVFMCFLHAAAREAGAKRVRLSVDAGNQVAIRLYRSLGYTFEEASGAQLIGHINL